ncbi:10015_t:CDS:2 [Acaulospora morrowiae]|uniref:10015_t:CDS:1 n=1 Tax=Acaulospora morrowiae TaxID=94023 RepID=A0A9N8YU06_9GLOM|nr:10015_t:CDS:2 [Acaulospora morrowiae]
MRHSYQEDSTGDSPLLKVEFEVGRTLILQPKQVVRGTVVLIIPERSRSLWVSGVKIRFRGEEIASVKSKDAETGTMRRANVARTIYFERNYVVWPSALESQPRANEYRPWSELNSGIYRFDFALKLPAVNFPPSIEGPKGFSIRYIWQPIIEGSGGPLVEGPEVVTLFIPISFAPPAEEWIFRDTLYYDNKPQKKMNSLIEVEAVLPKHVFSPGEEIKISLSLTNRSNGRITRVQISLRKHYEGPLDTEFVCEKHERALVSSDKRCDIGTTGGRITGNLEFFLSIPPKFYQVPPTFEGRHLRVYYTLRCVIQSEMGRLFTKMQYHEVTIPIAIAPYAHIPHDKISELNFPSHEESQLSPFFFDPREDFPPDDKETQNKNGALSYDSILNLPLNNYVNEDYSSEDRSSGFT